MAPNSEKTNQQTVLEQVRDTIHDAVKTEKIEERENEASKPAVVKAANSITSKVGSMIGASTPKEPEGPPREDNVFVEAAKMITHDVKTNIEKAREKIYEITEPPAAPKK